MGWGSGGELFAELIEILQEEVSDDEARVRIYKKAIVAFEGQDWDTQPACLSLDPAFDRALREHDPSLFEDD